MGCVHHVAFDNFHLVKSILQMKFSQVYPVQLPMPVVLRTVNSQLKPSSPAKTATKRGVYMPNHGVSREDGATQVRRLSTGASGRADRRVENDARQTFPEGATTWSSSTVCRCMLKMVWKLRTLWWCSQKLFLLHLCIRVAAFIVGSSLTWSRFSVRWPVTSGEHVGEF